jgi:hypothetical protein
MSDNRALRRLFGPKRKYVAGGWIQFYIEGLYNFNFSPNISIVIKLKRMRWVKIYRA